MKKIRKLHQTIITRIYCEFNISKTNKLLLNKTFADGSCICYKFVNKSISNKSFEFYKLIYEYVAAVFSKTRSNIMQLKYCLFH